MNPLLLGPGLLVRAWDDLQAVATAARSLGRSLRELEERADRVEQRLDEAIGAVRSIDSRAEDVLGIAERMLELGERIDLRAEALLAVGDRVDVVANEAIIEARNVQLAAAQVAAALPLLQRALELAEPLEGAVERIGRIVDRVPGGRAASRPGRRSAAQPGG